MTDPKITPAIAEAQDTAQQMVTALLHGDRALAAEIMQGYRFPEVLALVLADLVAFAHSSWCSVLFGNEDVERRNGSWIAMMKDVEAWRAGLKSR